ncbi:VOC family protein [Staphylococcus nepalensis]|uniref:VOC family protein n=1 Tax=Staphylococcus nepalensis TaxID=214473 RepID=UPI001E4234D4|nr:VOC family protein [Staphylococcus nepalensis]MCD8891941.1 VOC family protein [Staphylococcus nepalensis]
MTFHDKSAIQVTNVTLNVKNLTDMVDFYTRILGLTVMSKNENTATLQVGLNGHTMTLFEIQDGRQPSIREAGLFHIALLLPERKDLADFLFHVSQLNIPVGGGDHLVSEALYLNDPEGNGIEVYYDRSENEWLWKDNKVKMDTLQVDINNLLKQRTEIGWKKMPSNAKIGHLHLKTSDLEIAQRFYINQLELTHISNFPQALFMSTKNYHHHIAVNTWQANMPRVKNGKSYGLAHIDIYKPHINTVRMFTIDGLAITVHNHTELVADKT